MKKYIFAALTFVIGFFLIVIFQVLVLDGAFIRMVLFALLFTATALVYRKFKALEPELESELNPYRLSEAEQESFRKIFSQFQPKDIGIKEILVGKARTSKADYAIVLRTENGLFKHSDVIRKAISKEFGSGKKNEIFLNAREEELERSMRSVHRISMT